MVLPLCIAILA